MHMLHIRQTALTYHISHIIYRPYICSMIHSTQSYSSDEFPKLLSINIASSGCSLRMTDKVIPLTNFRNYWRSYSPLAAARCALVACLDRQGRTSCLLVAAGTYVHTASYRYPRLILDLS